MVEQHVSSAHPGNTQSIIDSSGFVGLIASCGLALVYIFAATG